MKGINEAQISFKHLHYTTIGQLIEDFLKLSGFLCSSFSCVVRIPFNLYFKGLVA